MNFRLLSGLTVLLCAAFSSCYPLEDPRIKQGTEEPSPLTEEQTQHKQQEDQRLKTAEEELRQQQANLDNSTNNNTQTTTSDYPFANKVPGKEGFVFSPYNNKVIDVRQIPSGTLVQDPTYPASEQKYFRVP